MRESVRSQRSAGRGDSIFDRLVIETSGLADPAPIVYTLMSEAVLAPSFPPVADRHHGRRGRTARHSSTDFPKPVKQVSMADRLVMTKADFCDETDAGGAARTAAGAQRFRANPRFERTRRRFPSAADRRHLRRGRQISRGEPLGRGGDRRASQITPRTCNPSRSCSTARSIGPRSASGPACCCIAMAPTCCGSRDLLNVAGVPTPVLINGVQHIVHPPSHLEAWPDADRRSRLIFIVRGLQRARIERSLAVFNDLVNASRRPRRPDRLISQADGKAYRIPACAG